MRTGSVIYWKINQPILHLLQLIKFFISEDLLDAENIWCLHVIPHIHCSMVFQRIFKTCLVVQQFHMKIDEAGYMIVYDLYPALKVKNKKTYHPGSVSLWMKVWTIINKNAKWMWTFAIGIVKKNVAQLLHYDSQFLQRPNAVCLKEEIVNSVEDVDMRKFLHLGHDRPRAKWNVLDKTLGIGSCLLYILPSAFQTGMIKPGWDIGKIVKMLYKIFDESPAHCDVDLCKGTYKVFPIKFCSTRLIENQPVADWAWEVWFSVVSTVKHWLSKFKQPKNSKSYDTMVEHHQDSVIPAKFYFFSFITGILKRYFVIFQSDRPLYWCLMKLVLSFIVWWGWFARKSKLTILLVSEKWWIKIFSPIKATNLKNSLLI